MKINVAVFFGGASVEHDISIISALQVIEAIDKDKYQVIPIYLSNRNQFYTGEYLLNLANYQNEKFLLKCQEVSLVNSGDKFYFEYHTIFKRKRIYFDIALPVVHGKGIEDGTLFGLFELYNIPYVGPSIVGAAIAQDKEYMKDILITHGFNLIPYYAFLVEEYEVDSDFIIDNIEELKYPLIVKPANLGSSIGIGRANNRLELKNQIDNAKKYDYKIVVEKMVTNLMEVNCSVIGTPIKCRASIIEEVISDKDILTFHEKYERSSEGTGMASLKRRIPANISRELEDRVKELSTKAFRILNGLGIARIDFIIDKDNNSIYFNEINTIPGSLSYYLWDKSNLRFDQLIDELIEIGRKNNLSKKKLLVDFKSNAINNISKTGKLIK